MKYTIRRKQELKSEVRKRSVQALLIHLVGVLGILLFFVCPGSAHQVSERSMHLNDLMEAYHRYHKFNGVVLVAENGRVVYQRAFGPAVLEFGVMNTLKTRFRVASITKIFTATLVLQLMDEGLVDLDKPVGRYLKAVRPEIAKSITIRQLLEHKSGLGREYFPRSQDLNRDYSMSELVKAVNDHTKQIEEPAKSVKYSNAGYVLLAAVIENVTGEKYSEALRKRILEPLKMLDTGVEEKTAAVIPRLARGYRLRLGTYRQANRIGMSWTRGNGGVYSTAHDLLRFDRGLRKSTLLSKKAKEMFFQKGPSTFAISWQVANNPTGYPKNVGRIAWARGANQTGFRVQWTRQLDADRVVILLTNLDYSPRNEITQKIFTLLLKGSVSLPERPLSNIALDIYKRDGIDAALAVLTKTKATDENKAGQAVNEILELGHHLIRAQNPKAAIGFFELCNRLYPDLPGIINSLAYAHLEAGNKAKATELARRVLTLKASDSEVSDAREILKGSEGKH